MNAVIMTNSYRNKKGPQTMTMNHRVYTGTEDLHHVSELRTLSNMFVSSLYQNKNFNYLERIFNR